MLDFIFFFVGEGVVNGELFYLVWFFSFFSDIRCSIVEVLCFGNCKLSVVFIYVYLEGFVGYYLFIFFLVVIVINGRDNLVKEESCMCSEV